MYINKKLHSFQFRVFTLVVYVTWILYIVIALNLSVSAPEYLSYLQSLMKIYISLFLIYRFNSFRRVTFTELDAKIAFSAGLFLLGTTAIDNILQYYLSSIKEYINWIIF
jgi:hypothetical protein